MQPVAGSTRICNEETTKLTLLNPRENSFLQENFGKRTLQINLLAFLIDCKLECNTCRVRNGYIYDPIVILILYIVLSSPR